MAEILRFSKAFYKNTANLPKEEVFGLQSQMRRSAISIVSNITEGKGRGTRKDYVHFFNIAYGSVLELEAQTLLVKELYNLEVSKELDLLSEIGKMLNVLIKKLETEN